MKKSYVNPAAKTANVRIRTTLLAGSQKVIFNPSETNGTDDDIIDADARTRVVGSLD